MLNVCVQNENHQNDYFDFDLERERLLLRDLDLLPERDADLFLLGSGLRDEDGEYRFLFGDPDLLGDRDLRGGGDRAGDLDERRRGGGGVLRLIGGPPNLLCGGDLCLIDPLPR